MLNQRDCLPCFVVCVYVGSQTQKHIIIISSCYKNCVMSSLKVNIKRLQLQRDFSGKLWQITMMISIIPEPEVKGVTNQRRKPLRKKPWPFERDGDSHLHCTMAMAVSPSNTVCKVSFANSENWVFTFVRKSRWIDCRQKKVLLSETLGILAHRTSDDEQGVYNHLRNERYLGSITFLRRWLDP